MDRAWRTDVVSTPVGEVLAAEAAYRALRDLDPWEQDRAMAWVKSRMETDQRGREAAQYPDIEPTDWIVAGQVEGPSYPSRDEVIDNEGHWSQVIEVTGRAAVRQYFAVIIPTDGGGNETMWYDDREKAEAFLAAMQGDR